MRRGSIIVLYALAGIVVGSFFLESTVVGADLGTYQRASRDLWVYGDPYRSAGWVDADFQYRYPPLLAMMRPLLETPPAWYLITAVATGYPIFVAVKLYGWAGILPGLLLLGCWAQQLLNGNAQAIVIALMAMVPFHARFGAVGLAVATMLKLHPVLGVAWYVANRRWRSLAWFAGAMVALTMVQLPWWDDFIRYYTANEAATSTVAGLSIRTFGLPVWVGGAVVVGVLAYRAARSRWGWLLNVVWQLVVLPRILLVNLALLLAAPPDPSIRSRQTAARGTAPKRSKAQMARNCGD